MNCAEFHQLVEALARQEPMDASLRGSALAHSQSCTACRCALSQAQELTAVLRRAAHQNRQVRAPVRIEENLLRAFDERKSSRRVGKGALLARHRWFAAVTASVAAIGIALLSWGPQLDLPPVEQAATIGNDSEGVIASEFFPLQGEMEVPPSESSGVVRVAVPRVTLLAFGLPMNPELAMEPIEAEILVGEDGAAQAIRFLHGRQ
jgi:predicted anti-sigma-YlaC factor YlaD